jgi:hypothetical protein
VTISVHLISCHMINLVFEIWRDDTRGIQEMSRVSRQGDKLRLLTLPNAMLVHSFTAHSDFDAFQKNYDWNGWGVWQPPELDWREQLFSAEEAAAQQSYLAERNGSH